MEEVDNLLIDDETKVYIVAAGVITGKRIDAIC